MDDKTDADYQGAETTGFQSPAQDHIEHVLDLPDILDLRRPGMYPVRVVGQAFRDRGIHHGDILIANAAADPAPGMVVNYVLYGDMSRRLYEVLQRFSPRVEPYSIDEMFLDLDGIPGSLLDHCHAARTAVRRETKIPTCIGFAETKTKAKLANYVAKKRPEYGGVCDLRSAAECASLYPTIRIEEVWGIGGASAKKLNALGINTVAELIDIDLRQARDVLTVTGAVVMELRGRSCLPLTLLAPQRKGLAVIRTFGTAVTEWHELAEAVSTYAARAGEKLRQHGLLACAMTVFIQTNRFVSGAFYSNAASFGLEPTQDSFALIELALKGVRRIWKSGFRYWKAGVMLNDLIDAKTAPCHMFPARDPERSAKLMAVLDGVNGRFGRGALRPAVTGIDRKWTAKAKFLSTRYTTRLDDLMRVYT
jgi:DNA polymerase V